MQRLYSPWSLILPNQWRSPLFFMYRIKRRKLQLWIVLTDNVLHRSHYCIVNRITTGRFWVVSRNHWISQLYWCVNGCPTAQFYFELMFLFYQCIRYPCLPNSSIEINLIYNGLFCCQKFSTNRHGYRKSAGIATSNRCYCSTNATKCSNKIGQISI